MGQRQSGELERTSAHTHLPLCNISTLSCTSFHRYCTGGIRCDVYSTFLRSKGFKNLYTLEGGIQNYLHEQGAQHWDGSLYVFDGRMAIAPNGSCKYMG